MKHLKLILLASLLTLAGPAKMLAGQERWLGGDISLLPTYEAAGTKYLTADGQQMPLLQMASQAGWNAARVRLFVDPSQAPEVSKKEGVRQDLSYVIQLCRQIKQAGMAVMLDFHYSDTWADPSHQTIPSRWQKCNAQQLADSIYSHTRQSLLALKAAGIVPEMIQVGNEITNGMLWPVGKVDPSKADENFPTLASFIASGSKACREICPEAKLIVHTERAGEWEVTKNFYQQIDQLGADYDIVGLSYYPMWHKSVKNLDATLDSLQAFFPKKDVMIVEAAFYYSHDNDPWAKGGQYSEWYDISPEGQAQFTHELVTMLRRHAQVTGLFWWFPEENESGEQKINGWINRGLFDNHTGRALPAWQELSRYALPTTTVANNSQATRNETLLKDWQFSRDQRHFADVSVPHDWAIGGPFDKQHDLQFVAIEQNGETEKSEKSGRSGALPWIGRGYYKTTVVLDEVPENALLHFDGAMSEPVVTINGQAAGYWAYGYNAFRVDATPFLHQGENLIEVSLNNREESSRWYPGGGLYRPVTLITTQRAHIDTWGGYFRTLKATAKKATLSIATQVKGGNTAGLTVENLLLDNQGKEIKRFKSSTFDAQGTAIVTAEVAQPNLWSPESPYLYTLVTRITQNGTVVDETSKHVGIRTVKVSKDGGFQLNGVSRKLKGVCLHHDLGPLGAAINKAALIRQIRMMKDMGCDAIRTAHNMPSTMQMEVCDSMGMMVMAESFDMWIYPKCKNGYATFFKEWADRDIENLVFNHRDHPSIVMWSIGNEIPEQWSEEGREIARHLQDICHRLDPTRPVTQGMDKAEDALHSGFAQVMDVPGFNYRVHKYDNSIQQLPQGFLLGSETASTVSSRGIYKFPVTVGYDLTYADGQCNSYDTEYCAWSNLPDDDWRMQDDRTWTIGEFVWTGFDYLGEPSPYDGYWPSRSSYFGICDLAGLPKDRYWLYRSHWRNDAPTLHLLPHWTWPGREGEQTPVYCYTSFPEAELFVNGESQGRIAKSDTARLDRYRLRWNNVKYQPGELRVVAYDKKGNKAAEQTVRTAGAPAAIRLEADRSTIKADGNDLSFITVSLVDKDGNFCPTADDNCTFEVSGEGSFRATCNGDATSLQPFTRPEMRLFSGQLVVVVQSGQTAGNITLKVDCPRLGLTNTLTIEAK